MSEVYLYNNDCGWGVSISNNIIRPGGCWSIPLDVEGGDVFSFIKCLFVHTEFPREECTEAGFAPFGGVDCLYGKEKHLCFLHKDDKFCRIIYLLPYVYKRTNAEGWLDTDYGTAYFNKESFTISWI